MSDLKNGGPAFPVHDPFLFQPANVVEAQKLAGGMSLRDYFAGQVIGGMVADPSVRDLSGNAGSYARKAYLVADAMVAESKRGGAL